MIPSDTEFCPIFTGIFDPVVAQGISMASKRTDIAIEKIVAACDGNMHGAIEALLLVNEHLEAELHQLYAAISTVPPKGQRLRSVH
ncbi:MAG: hypothetical protein QOC84_2919 [Bradyrhizobium sp.]|jgi:hypothetical protein|nr:hypothetical protein [Bradyrhizobium sp.]